MSFTVTLRPFQSFLVSLAISSPTFLGERPSGPIFGASEEAAPTSPPVARRKTSMTEEGSNLGGILLCKSEKQKMVRIVTRIDVRCNGERKRSTRDGDRSAYFEAKKAKRASRFRRSGAVAQ